MGVEQARQPARPLPSAVVLFLYQGCIWFCLWFLLGASAKLTFSLEIFLWKFLITSLPAVKLGKGDSWQCVLTFLALQKGHSCTKEHCEGSLEAGSLLLNDFFTILQFFIMIDDACYRKHRKVKRNRK